MIKFRAAWEKKFFENGLQIYMQIEEFKAEIAAFNSKYENTRLNTPEGKERREIAKFCSLLECQIVVFGHEPEHGIPYYQKSIEIVVIEISYKIY